MFSLTSKITASWRRPVGDSGLLAFFLTTILPSPDLTPSLQKQSLRLVGNACAECGKLTLSSYCDEGKKQFAIRISCFGLLPPSILVFPSALFRSPRLSWGGRFAILLGDKGTKLPPSPAVLPRPPILPSKGIFQCVGPLDQQPLLPPTRDSSFPA